LHGTSVLETRVNGTYSSGNRLAANKRVKGRELRRACWQGTSLGTVTLKGSSVVDNLGNRQCSRNKDGNKQRARNKEAREHVCGILRD